MISVVCGMKSMTKRTAQQLVSFTILLVFAVLQGAAAAEDYLDYYEQGEFALPRSKVGSGRRAFHKIYSG